MRSFVNFIILFLCFVHLSAQNNLCNKLGAWLWYIENTDFPSHSALAARLSSLDISRVYVKVADGKVNPDVWPELEDKMVVDAYKQKGIEVWAWSYNYPGNDSLQAEALYLAAKTGYQGFVVDVETEFDNKSLELRSIFSAFDKAKKRAINENLVSDDFSLYVTTWGNPIDHNFKISEMDPFVNGYMPQTYVENWGPSYMDNIPKWIEEGNKEYKQLGATKPIHHIISTEKGILTAAQINNFFEYSGGETSIWRIPGGNVPQNIWNTWQDVNWKRNFCTSSVNDDLKEQIFVYPNPAFDVIHFEGDFESFFIATYLGDVIMRRSRINHVDISSLKAGMYIVKFDTGKVVKFIKYEY